MTVRSGSPAVRRKSETLAKRSGQLSTLRRCFCIRRRIRHRRRRSNGGMRGPGSSAYGRTTVFHTRLLHLTCKGSSAYGRGRRAAASRQAPRQRVVRIWAEPSQECIRHVASDDGGMRSIDCALRPMRRSRHRGRLRRRMRRHRGRHCGRTRDADHAHFKNAR